MGRLVLARIGSCAEYRHTWVQPMFGNVGSIASWPSATCVPFQLLRYRRRHLGLGESLQLAGYR